MGKNNSITVIALKNQIRKALKEPKKLRFLVREIYMFLLTVQLVMPLML